MQWGSQGRFCYCIFQGAAVDTLQRPIGSRSGNAKHQRCERFWFRCHATVPTVSTTTRGLAVCTTRLASVCTLCYRKLKHLKQKLAKTMTDVGHWKMFGHGFACCEDFNVGFRSLAWSHCRSCIISAFDTDLAAFDDARTVVGWFTWITQWPPNRPSCSEMRKSSWRYLS